MSPPEIRTRLRAGRRERSGPRDNITGETLFTTDDDDGRERIEAIGLEVANARWQQFRILDEDPLSARNETAVGARRWAAAIGRSPRAPGVVMTATPTHFCMTAELDALRGTAASTAATGTKRSPAITHKDTAMPGLSRRTLVAAPALIGAASLERRAPRWRRRPRC